MILYPLSSRETYLTMSLWSAWMTIGSPFWPGTTADARGTTCFLVNCHFSCRAKATYHDRGAKGRRSLVLFERKLRHEIAADRPVLTQLLLKQLRVPFEVPK